MKEESQTFKLARKEHRREVLQMKKAEMKQRHTIARLENEKEKQHRFLLRKQEEVKQAQLKIREFLKKQEAAENVRRNGDLKDEKLEHWITDEIELSLSLRQTRKALAAETRRRKEIPVENVGEKAACSSRIAELQSTLCEIQEQDLKRRWARVRTLPEAKAALKFLFKNLVQEREKAIEANALLQDANDQIAQTSAGRSCSEAALRRDFEERILFCLQSKGFAFTENDVLEQLQQENEDLLAQLQAQGLKVGKTKTKKNKAKRGPKLTEEELREIWTSSSSEGDTDDEDEEWTMERKRVTRKKSSPGSQGRSFQKQQERKPETQKEEPPRAMETDENAGSEKSEEIWDFAKDRLSADLIARIENFKVKELQNSLALIGGSVTGRKDALRARLVDLLMKTEIVLPKEIPERQKKVVNKVSGEKEEDEGGENEKEKENKPFGKHVSMEKKLAEWRSKKQSPPINNI